MLEGQLFKWMRLINTCRLLITWPVESYMFMFVSESLKQPSGLFPENPDPDSLRGRKCEQKCFEQGSQAQVRKRRVMSRLANASSAIMDLKAENVFPKCELERC